MRILRSLASFLVIILVLGVIGLFIAREVILLHAMTAVATEFQRLEKRVIQGNYVTECTKLAGSASDGVAQLRFVGPREYVLEVVCDDIYSNPILVSKGQLSPLVQKRYSDAGLAGGREATGIVALQVLGRYGLVERTMAGNVEWRYGELPEEYESSGLPSSCQAFGTVCCREQEEEGYGIQVSTAVDCPKNCYEGCWQRPVVLSFNTQPFYDIETRSVTVMAGEDVEFSYVVSESQIDSFADSEVKQQQSPQDVILAALSQLFQPGGARQKLALKEVTITFGDGKMERLNELQGSVTHQYSCQQPKCSYTAKISASNMQEVDALATHLSSIVIQVTGK